MKRIILSLFATSSLLSHAQYCMTSGPSSTADSNLESLTLTGAAGTISYTGCPGVTGVQEYLAQTAFLNAGGSYTVYLQFGTCGGNYSGVGQAWIDFNINGIFEASESIGTWQGLPPTAPSAFSFMVPGGASNGPTRMRVVHYEGGTIPINPCAAFTWGSTTDFSIYLQNGVDCSSYIGDDTSDPRVVASLPFTENHSTSVCYSNQNTVYGAPDVFYLVKPGAGTAALNISLCGSAFDTFLSVFDTQGNALAINDDSQACGLQSELQVSTLGHDTVYVVVDGWGTNSGNYTINIGTETLGINESEVSSIGIYPNPAGEQLHVTGIQDGILEIFSSNGALVLSADLNQNKTIDISSLDKAMYLVKITSGAHVQNLKLLVE